MRACAVRHNGAVNNVAVRAATVDEIPAVAELRWQWFLDNSEQPHLTRDELVDRFVA